MLKKNNEKDQKKLATNYEVKIKRKMTKTTRKSKLKNYEVKTRRKITRKILGKNLEKKQKENSDRNKRIRK